MGTNAVINFLTNTPANVVTSYYVGVEDSGTSEYVSQVRLLTTGEVQVRTGDEGWR